MNRRRDESGSVVVLVALLAVFLLGMSAFVADFGVAYANKRQIQTAADAAALGAAGVFGEQPGTCQEIRTAGGAAATAEATTKVAQNEPPSAPATLTGFETTCTADGLVVHATVGGDSPNFFGGLLGGSGPYTLERSAGAIVEAAATVGAGLRPMAICSTTVGALTTFPSPVMKVAGPGRAANSVECPDASSGGNWWTLNCPEDGGNGEFDENIRNGCADPVTIVPGQDGLTGAALSSHLLNYCPNFITHPESCLGADPGNDLSSAPTMAAFDSLITSGELIFMPLFCGAPTCNPAAITPDNGNGVIYPVHKLVAAQICGYHFGNGNHHSGDMPMHGLCANNPSNYWAGDGGQHDNYLLIAVEQVQVAGGTAPTSCTLGDLTCDTGLRQVRMVAGPDGY